MDYQVGDIIGLPPEPPIGTELKCTDSAGRFRIVRSRNGWRIVGGSSEPISWRAAFIAYGPGAPDATPFEVSKLRATVPA